MILPPFGRAGVGFTSSPTPTQGRGSVDGWGKYGLPSSLLAFKTKWRKKGQNTSAQGNALGINTLPTIAQNGQKNYPVYLPFASAVVVGCHSFATFGATI